MSTLYYLIRGQARSLQSTTNRRLSECQEILAYSYHCQSFHELRQLAKNDNCTDERLAAAWVHPYIPLPLWVGSTWRASLERQNRRFASALNISSDRALLLTAYVHGFGPITDITPLDCEEIFQDNWDKIDLRLEDLLNGEIAGTNASMFMIDDYGFTDFVVDVKNPDWLTLLTEIQYTGDQDPDRPWSGTSFDVSTQIEFSWDGVKWSLEEMEILSCSSDFDRAGPDY